MIIAVLVLFSPINQEILLPSLRPAAMATAALCLTNKEIDANWMPVTPFDPFLAIRQKRGGEAPPEDPPKTRENRITAVGNDLYSADSRSFLNPFLRISQGVRAFFHRTLDGTPIHRTIPIGHRPCLFLSLLPFSRGTRVQVPRALHEAEIVLSRKSRLVSSRTIRTVAACVRAHARRVFVHSRKHQYLILLLSQ